MFRAIGSRLKGEALFIGSASLLLSALAYQDHSVFIAGAIMLFSAKIHLDMSEAIVTVTAKN